LGVWKWHPRVSSVQYLNGYRLDVNKSLGLRSVLSQYGAVPPEKVADEDDKDKQPKKSIYQSKSTAALSSDEESDDDDRGYY
jgi:hypothetical protein